MTEPVHQKALDRAQVETLVHEFYRDVRSDELLAPVFGAVIGDDWSVHLQRMVEFWSTVMLGSRSFRGNVYGKHMAIDGVRQEHFLRWITLWHRHTDRLFSREVAEEFQRTAHGIGRNLFHGFFGEFPKFVMRDGVAIGHEPDAWVAP
ncbi:group III truncated hemoglobin [Rhizobacter sp. SG703]|uniref:group III truncated hemoglobin n=1 Tax=Rhizobacter sp. SG703 TaxID=2587140 RepID=UPI00144739A6|nr:group III truncated hemoglobin [Rhizobacter sp. SG703]NKI92459.1 hemoglobin [Rhizobacter sp. SG703]